MFAKTDLNYNRPCTTLNVNPKLKTSKVILTNLDTKLTTTEHPPNSKFKKLYIHNSVEYVCSGKLDGRGHFLIIFIFFKRKVLYKSVGNNLKVENTEFFFTR